ncbi:MAG: TRAP transporter substrate-binding protein DctP [Alphaproteobacteria bacterium]|nr:TRAP transporter substrate-binding protein DctP [Alphaproteobacteria bacterium]
MKLIAVTASSLALAGLAFAGVTIPTAAEAATKACNEAKTTWRFSFWGKRRAFTEAMEYVTKRVSDQTCGNFKIRLYYGEQLSKSKENLDSISVGAIDATSFCAAYHPGKNRPLNVLDLPFLPLANFDVMRRVHDAVYAHPASKKALAKWNAVIYMSNILPQYEYMGRGKPPKSVKDFKGLRLRALGGMGRSAKAIGAVPTTMPAPETYTALQRGTVDAIGFPFTYSFSAYKLDEVADWYTTNMSLGSVTCPTVFNKTAYEKLPASYKKILAEAVPGAYDALKANYAAKDKANLARWGKSKMKAIKIPESEMAEFRRIGGEPLWKAWVEENKGQIPAQELLDLVLKTAKQ